MQSCLTLLQKGAHGGVAFQPDCPLRGGFGSIDSCLGNVVLSP
jgi:hypothetical protein